jgi:hypothetical protein
MIYGYEWDDIGNGNEGTQGRKTKRKKGKRKAVTRPMREHKMEDAK